MAEEDSFALGRQSARAEALGLYRMLGDDGNTVEALCELIAVPPLIERVLRAFAQAHPEEAYSIEVPQSAAGKKEFVGELHTGILADAAPHWWRKRASSSA